MKSASRPPLIAEAARTTTIAFNREYPLKTASLASTTTTQGKKKKKKRSLLIIIQDLTPGNIRQSAKDLRLNLQRDIHVLQNEIDSQGHRTCAISISILSPIDGRKLSTYTSPTTTSSRQATPPSSSGANCTISAAPTGYTRELCQSCRVHLPRRGCPRPRRSRWPWYRRH